MLYSVCKNKWSPTNVTLLLLGPADLPDPPRFPQVENIFHDSVLMTWKPPLNDGGSFISQYIVEKCEPPDENWVRCAVTRCASLRQHNRRSVRTQFLKNVCSSLPLLYLPTL